MRASILIAGIAGLGCAQAVWLGCGGATNDGGLTATDTDGGTTGTSGGPRQAGPNGVTADGGVNPTSAAPGGDTANIPCGATTCPIPAEACCVSELSNNGRSYACVVGTTCPGNNNNNNGNGGGDEGDTVALKCTSAANCATGTVCCVTQKDNATTSACQATCTSGNGTDAAQLCDPTAPNGGGCPASAPCSTNSISDWALPKTFGTCGGKGN